PLIWNKSIAFQKFQRYAHGEMELDEYLAYLAGHIGSGPRAFPLYANDVEIFDFRPGRYHTEAPLQEDGEWRRLDLLFAALRADPRFELVPPGRVLGMMGERGAGRPLRLGSPEQPIPVKKQGKYNVVRWAVTGRDDLGINTACWRLFKTLSAKPRATDDEWRELCYLWSSDFRTHITERRWKSYTRRLSAFGKKVGAPALLPRPPARSAPGKTLPSGAARRGGELTIRSGRLTVKMNCRRGLALQGVWLGPADGPPLVGTLPHGFYDDISFGSDWYTGHAVLEAPGQPKITDLAPIEPSVAKTRSGDWLVSAKIPTPLGPVFKSVGISARNPALTLSYRFEWARMPMGSLRLGNITLHPDSFRRASLRYAVRNGGRALETFPLAGTTVDHGAPVSFLVSARTALGMTDGRVELGDARRRVVVESDQASAALVGMISYRETNGSYFCRLALSAGELDETRRPETRKKDRLACRVSLRFE
ncbi:MAG: glycoside hydrolase family 57, partial [Elusimicrobia bacterium]|nr:glycoside hydrolase family 57 [Elusimicrobiota bacterium]